MPVAIAATIAGLIVVLIAYYRDAPVEASTLRQPDWDLLPDPSDVARTEFPLAIPGYEPATVEFHFDMLTRAYADLLASATPEVIARARHRASVRRGIELPASDDPAPVRAEARSAQPAHAPRSTLAPLSSEGADAQALRAEAAMAELDLHETEPGR